MHKIRENEFFLWQKIAYYIIIPSEEVKVIMAKEETDILVKTVDIPEEVARIELKEFNLSNRLIIKLHRGGIDDLGTLLRTHIRTYRGMRGMGITYITELIHYVHSIGYSLQGEEEFVPFILEEKKASGVKLLEDYDFPPRVVTILYRNGIYTLEELLERQEEVKSFASFGQVRQQELADKMDELGILFPEKKQEEVLPIQSAHREVSLPLPLDKSVQELSRENDGLRSLINRKKILLNRYQELLAEKQELLATSARLDSEIEIILASMQKSREGIKHG